MEFPADYFFPIELEDPPLTEAEQVIEEERECAEAQRLAELFGPKPGRFETEWSL